MCYRGSQPTYEPAYKVRLTLQVGSVDPLDIMKGDLVGLRNESLIAHMQSTLKTLNLHKRARCLIFLRRLFSDSGRRSFNRRQFPTRV